MENRLKKGLGRGLSSLLGDASKKIQTNKKLQAIPKSEQERKALRDAQDKFNKSTLGGCIIEKKEDFISISKEEKSRLPITVGK